ncbi:unnamed protein product [Timema podura]|uniref:Uncharacterized protein n=1 Tax=Timema podura TaxID=61482 RepID=A0ABN7PEC5_TIMPD|nr:unnamed protein product [Timema podura]
MKKKRTLHRNPVVSVFCTAKVLQKTFLYLHRPAMC